MKKRKVASGLDFFSFNGKERHKKAVDYYYEHLYLLEKDLKKVNSECFIGFGLLQKVDIIALDRFNRICMIEILIDAYDKNLRTGRFSLEDDEKVLKEMVLNLNQSTDEPMKMPKYRLFTLSITKTRVILREFKPFYTPKSDKSQEEIINFIKMVWEKCGNYYIKQNKKSQGLGQRIVFVNKDVDFLRRVRDGMAIIGFETGKKGLKDSGIWVKKSKTKVLYYNIGEEFFEKVRPLITQKQMDALKESLNWSYYGKEVKDKIRYFTSILKVVEKMTI
jgi:hypothetical protein